MKRGLRRKLSISAIALAILIAGGVAGRQWYIGRPEYGLPYYARFLPDVEDRWTGLGGSWEVVAGGMRNDSNDRGAKLLTGSPNWKDYTIEGDVQPLGTGSVGFLARVSEAEVGENSFKGYLAGVRTVDNSLFLGVFDFAYHEAAKVVMPAGSVRPFRWYHIKLTVDGCQIIASASAVGVPEIKTPPLNDPDCFQSGTAGLRSNGTGGIWRNVTVLPLDMAAAATASNSRDLPDPDIAAFQDLALTSDHGQRGDGMLLPRDDSPTIHPQPVNTLLYLPPFGSPVASIRGSVVLTKPVIFVQDSTGGVEIQSSHEPPLKIGDEVEVTGEISLDKSSPVIRKAKVRVLREAIPASPAVVTANQLADGYFDGRFVQVEAYLRGISPERDGTTTMDLDAGTQSFHAILPAGRSRSHLNHLTPESRIRLRGISVIDARFNRTFDPFVILVRSAEDVDVVAGPPWWRPSTLIFATIVTLVLIFVLNHLYLQARHWRLRAVTEERERLAHEIHDTLAQSFAGIGFQLQAIRNGIPKNALLLERQVDQAILMARTSHEEARRSIASMRPESSSNTGLLPALRDCAERMVRNGGVKVEVYGEDGGRVASSRVKDTLFRIGQEAIANAIRHANPTTIRIRIQHQRATLCLSIEDDGAGFRADGDHAGFGLLGMRRRAESISATLTIKSTPGSGTRVEVRTTVGSPLRVVAWAQPWLSKAAIWKL